MALRHGHDAQRRLRKPVDAEELSLGDLFPRLVGHTLGRDEDRLATLRPGRVDGHAVLARPLAANLVVRTTREDEERSA